VLTFLLFWILSGCQGGRYEPLTGDIVFQDSGGLSSREIKIATGSPYSHCGIVTVDNDSAFVIEAVGPVRKIPLAEWIGKGGGKFTAKRAIINVNAENIIKAAEEFLGLPYDRYYEWDDNKLYCSELVYKAYFRGDNVSLCPLRRFEDYRIESIRESIIERYGKVPRDLKLVAPADLAESRMLKTVHSDFSD
jgi:hypothetical protein